jgi:glycosyltransferase involved in cell wall biosynthesis
MGKKKSHSNGGGGRSAPQPTASIVSSPIKYYPFVSVCTPTFNRRPFIPTMLEMFRNQTYPKNRIEWIIVDDGTDKIRDMVENSGISQIQYVESPKRMNLGEKRNYMHTFCKGSIIVYWDDDDYYPPERISHAVEKLTEHKEALCAGSSELYVYFKHIQKMITGGPYGPQHSTAGTFAFRKELLENTRYDDNAALAEERAFLKNYTIPFVQLDPLKTILVFSHEHNTFDKRKLLENPHPQFLSESPKTVDMFIRLPKEQNIRKFFMVDIDGLLKNYELGEPKMKPDVIAQIKQIEIDREKMVRDMNMEANKKSIRIMMERPNQEPLALTLDDVLNMLKNGQTQLEYSSRHIKELEDNLRGMQYQLLEKTKENSRLKTELERRIRLEGNSGKPSNGDVVSDNTLKSVSISTPTPNVFTNVSKSSPEVFVSL